MVADKETSSADMRLGRTSGRQHHDRELPLAEERRHLLFYKFTGTKEYGAYLT